MLVSDWKSKISDWINLVRRRGGFGKRVEASSYEEVAGIPLPTEDFVIRR